VLDLLRPVTTSITWQESFHRLEGLPTLLFPFGRYFEIFFEILSEPILRTCSFYFVLYLSINSVICRACNYFIISYFFVRSQRAYSTVLLLESISAEPVQRPQDSSPTTGLPSFGFQPTAGIQIAFTTLQKTEPDRKSQNDLFKSYVTFSAIWQTSYFDQNITNNILIKLICLTLSVVPFLF
jgi:hypothetical protein